MDEQEKKQLEILKDFADKLLSIFDEYGRANSENKNEYLKEQTYRPSNLYITLNIAIISGTSILFSATKGNISVISKFLYLGILFSFLSIILEILNHKDYLRILDFDSFKRIENADTRRKELEHIMKNYQTNGFIGTFENLTQLTANLEKGNIDIQKETEKSLKPVNKRRKYSQIFMLIALISLFGIGLSELGFPQAFFASVKELINILEK